MESGPDRSTGAQSGGVLDGVIAAPAHHRVLFENDLVRVFESTIRVGDRTPPHTHPHQRVMYVVSGSSFTRRDRRGTVIEETRLPSDPADPHYVMWAGPTQLHTIENTGSDDLIVIAVELL